MPARIVADGAADGCEVAILQASAMGRCYPPRMTEPILADAFRHHVWATIRMLDACADLDPGQLATTAPGTYGSILDTLRHIVDGDAFYLDVLDDGAPIRYDPRDTDIPELRTIIEAHGPVWQRLASGAADGTIDVVEHEDSGWDTHAPLGIRMAQALYHGTDHRSQVCTALSTLGIEPPAIEPWDIAREDGRMRTVAAAGAAGGAAAGDTAPG